MSGKSQTIRDFTFLPTVPIFADISDNRQKSVQILPILNLAGNGKCAKH